MIKRWNGSVNRLKTILLKTIQRLINQNFPSKGKRHVRTWGMLITHTPCLTLRERMVEMDEGSFSLGLKAAFKPMLSADTTRFMRATEF